MTNRKSFLKALCSFCLIGAALCFVCSADSSSCSAQSFDWDLYNAMSASIQEVFNDPIYQVPLEDPRETAKRTERAYIKRQKRFNARFGNNPFEKPSALGVNAVDEAAECTEFRKEWGFLPPNHTETEYREIGQTAIAAALFVELGAPASKAKEAKMEKLFRICKERCPDGVWI